MSGSKPRSGWHEGRDSSWWTPRSPRSQASPRHPRRCDLARHGPRGRGGRRGPRCRVGEGGRAPPRPVALDREAPPGERAVQGGGDNHGTARVDPGAAAARSRGCPDGRLAGLPEWIRTCDLRPRRADARSTELPGARATTRPGLRLLGLRLLVFEGGSGNLMARSGRCRRSLAARQDPPRASRGTLPPRSSDASLRRRRSRTPPGSQAPCSHRTRPLVRRCR